MCNGNIKHNTVEYQRKQAFHNLAFVDLFSCILCITLSPISHMQLRRLDRSQNPYGFHVSKSLLMEFFCQDTLLSLSPCSSEAVFFIQIIFLCPPSSSRLSWSFLEAFWPNLESRNVSTHRLFLPLTKHLGRSYVMTLVPNTRLSTQSHSIGERTTDTWGWTRKPLMTSPLPVPSETTKLPCRQVNKVKLKLPWRQFKK